MWQHGTLRLCFRHCIHESLENHRRLYFVELAKSQSILPESKLSMRGSCTNLPFIPTPAICRTSSVECLSKCREEWPSPALCFNFTGILQDSILIGNSILLEIFSFDHTDILKKLEMFGQPSQNEGLI